MKTTVYLNKTAEELYQRAKEYDPEYSLSIAAEEGLRAFVDKMDAQYRGMDEIVLLDGTDSQGEIIGRKVKFKGKKLAMVQTQQVGPTAFEYQRLFLTKKGKYLLQWIEEDKELQESKASFMICHTLKELREKASPALLQNAGSSAGELLEELDV